jgi:hypothetical protein
MTTGKFGTGARDNAVPIFRILQADSDALMYLGFAKNQARRLIELGVKTFNKTWLIGDITVRARGTEFFGDSIVKLWLIAGGALPSLWKNSTPIFFNDKMVHGLSLATQTTKPTANEVPIMPLQEAALPGFGDTEGDYVMLSYKKTAVKKYGSASKYKALLKWLWEKNQMALVPLYANFLLREKVRLETVTTADPPIPDISYRSVEADIRLVLPNDFASTHYLFTDAGEALTAIKTSTETYIGADGHETSTPFKYVTFPGTGALPGNLVFADVSGFESGDQFEAKQFDSQHFIDADGNPWITKFMSDGSDLIASKSYVLAIPLMEVWSGNKNYSSADFVAVVPIVHEVDAYLQPTPGSTDPAVFFDGKSTFPAAKDARWNVRGIKFNKLETISVFVDGFGDIDLTITTDMYLVADPNTKDVSLLSLPIIAPVSVIDLTSNYRGGNLVVGAMAFCSPAVVGPSILLGLVSYNAEFEAPADQANWDAYGSFDWDDVVSGYSYPRGKLFYKVKPAAGNYFYTNDCIDGSTSVPLNNGIFFVKNNGSRVALIDLSAGSAPAIWRTVGPWYTGGIAHSSGSVFLNENVSPSNRYSVDMGTLPYLEFPIQPVSYLPSTPSKDFQTIFWPNATDEQDGICMWQFTTQATPEGRAIGVAAAQAWTQYTPAAGLTPDQATTEKAALFDAFKAQIVFLYNNCISYEFLAEYITEGVTDYGVIVQPN